MMFSVASSFSSVIYQGTLQSSHRDGKCILTDVMHLCFLETEKNRSSAPFNARFVIDFSCHDIYSYHLIFVVVTGCSCFMNPIS